MSLKRELYEDQRRKLRRWSFLKGFLLSSFIIAIAFIFMRKDFLSYPHIAVLEVVGEIYDDSERDAILREISNDRNAYGLMLKINSPGGSVVGAESIYESIRAVAVEKPVVVLIGEVGASAAYIAALGGDKIFVRGNSLVGSIGVIVQYPDLSKLAELIGVSVSVIKSSEAKGGPHPLKPMGEDSRRFQEALVNDSFQWFKDLVSKRRGIVGDELERISAGQLFTGRMAIDLKLADGLGSHYEALEYLENQDDKFVNLPLKNWGAENEKIPFWIDFFGFMNSTSLIKKINLRFTPMLFSITS